MCFPFFFFCGWNSLSIFFSFLSLSINIHSCAFTQSTSLSSWTKQTVCVLTYLLGTETGNIYFCDDYQSIRKSSWLFSAENHSVIMETFWCVDIGIHLPINTFFWFWISEKLFLTFFYVFQPYLPEHHLSYTENSNLPFCLPCCRELLFSHLGTVRYVYVTIEDIYENPSFEGCIVVWTVQKNESLKSVINQSG